VKGCFARRAGIRLVLLLAITGSLPGCATTFDARTLGVPVTLASPAGQPPQGSRFILTSHAIYGLWGLAKLKEPSLRKALAGQLGAGSGIADLRIKVRSRWSDILVTALTAGLIVPRAVTFEGVVLK
jgi:hypothetical protein